MGGAEMIPASGLGSGAAGGIRLTRNASSVEKGYFALFHM
jgi:hypothetical protein